jgi:hypothetical protein
MTINYTLSSSYYNLLPLAHYNFKNIYFVNTTKSKYTTNNLKNQNTLGGILAKVDLTKYTDNTQETQLYIETLLYNDYEDIFKKKTKNPTLIGGINADLLGKHIYDFITERIEVLVKYIKNMREISAIFPKGSIILYIKL